MNTSTVAPLKRARASLPPQQPSKKPRPNDKSINPRSSDSFVRTASDQERPPFTGRPNIMPSATRSLRETPDRDLVEMLSGTPSSPEPRSGSEDPMNLKDSPYRNTNSSAVAFEARSTPLNAAKSRSNEGDGLRTQGARIESSNPPRLDMLNVRKQNRVHLMKNRVRGLLMRFPHPNHANLEWENIKRNSAQEATAHSALDFFGKRRPSLTIFDEAQAKASSSSVKATEARSPCDDV
jgi:hypothetical protein